MLGLISSIPAALFAAVKRRPKLLQMAALCYRGEGHDKEYLLVTSRDTGRWIIPKGWPIRGLKSNETALREAWEEAGVANSKVGSAPIGSYTYNKRGNNGFERPVKTLVYAVAVNDLKDSFPEAEERQRKWVSADTAAELVEEAELKSIFKAQAHDLPCA